LVTTPAATRTGIDDALTHLADEPAVWVRVAATVDETGALITRLLELTSGEAPPRWELRSWQYPSASFLAAVEDGELVAEWLMSGMPTGDRSISIPTLGDSVTWERRQSGGTGLLETLGWPSVEATLSGSYSTFAEPSGHLVSPTDAPSFINYSVAAACFFNLDRQPTSGSLPQGVHYRHQDLRARMAAVRISADRVEVDVEGTDLRNLVVELAGDEPGRVERVWDRHRRGNATATFPMRGHLPSGAWILLKSGGHWLDRRFLAVPWTRSTEAGVEVIVEPRTRLEAFVADRETDTVEFKRAVPADDTGKAKVMKTVCAFANGSGGSVLFGIDDDQQLPGVPVQTVGRLRDQLTQTVGSWIEPRPRIDFSELPIGDGGSVVLELQVSPGTGLHGCARSGETPVVYVRHLATTVRARPSEIEAIVRSRSPRDVGPLWSVR
jgi:hypothetical protein